MWSRIQEFMLRYMNIVETDMIPGINIEISFDECETSLRIQGNNGSFAGEVCLDVNRDATVEFADAISGFPASSDDSRIFELGTFDPSFAGEVLRSDSIAPTRWVTQPLRCACEIIPKVQNLFYR